MHYFNRQCSIFLIIISIIIGEIFAKLPTTCHGGGNLKYLWGDALSDDLSCIGPTNLPYPTEAIQRSFKTGNPWFGSYRSGRSHQQQKYTIDPFQTRSALLKAFDEHHQIEENQNIPFSSRQGRASSLSSVPASSNNICGGMPGRLCKTRYNTTAPMYGVSLTSGQPYLFLVIPLGPVTLTGQDYVLVESGCVCRPKYSSNSNNNNNNHLTGQQQSIPKL